MNIILSLCVQYERIVAISFFYDNAFNPKYVSYSGKNGIK